MGEAAKDMKEAPKNKVDALTTKSELKGAAGFFETIFRKFRTIGATLILAPLGLICVFCIGVSMAPSIHLFFKVKIWVAAWNTPEVEGNEFLWKLRLRNLEGRNIKEILQYLATGDLSN